MPCICGSLSRFPPAAASASGGYSRAPAACRVATRVAHRRGRHPRGPRAALGRTPPRRAEQFGPVGHAQCRRSDRNNADLFEYQDCHRRRDQRAAGCPEHDPVRAADQSRPAPPGETAG